MRADEIQEVRGVPAVQRLAILQHRMGRVGHGAGSDGQAQRGT